MTNIIKSICMNRFFLFVFLQLVFFSAISQVQTHVVGDSVRVHGNNGKAEFILQNATDSVKGFLFNKGSGRTEFRKGLIRINDSMYLIGADTLRISLSGANGSLGLQQVTLVGDSTSNRIVVRKLITDSIYTHNKRLLLDSVPIKLVSPDYSYPTNGIYEIIAIGDSTLVNNQGNALLAIGTKALRSNTLGVANTAIGLYSLKSNTTGSFNTGVGYASLAGIQTSSNNVAVGDYTLNAGAVGDDNTAIGSRSQRYSISSTRNTSVGTSCLLNTSTGSSNTAVGTYTERMNTTGGGNTAFGYMALHNNVTGSNNVAIGNSAGYNETGSGKLYISNSSTANPLIYGDFTAGTLTFNGSVTTTGRQSFASTLTAATTTGNVTINTPSGTVNIASGGSSVTVTNSLVTSNSIVVAVIQTNDTSSNPVIKNVVPSQGSFIINLSAPTTIATTRIGFIVYNN